MTSDLESALREAREEIAIQRCHYAVSTVAWERSGKLIARIDAALSAASGEASGEEVDLIPIPKAEFFAAVPRPAPSEAPNPSGLSRKSREILNGDAYEAPNVERAREIAEHAGIDTLDDYDLFIAEMSAALDSARTEGIAAERDRCKKAAFNEIRRPCGCAERILVRIREAKP